MDNKTLNLHEAMTDLVLPAATGGDVTVRDSSLNTVTIPYLYQVSGLPPGLGFDPATRTISGTPVRSGTYTVTYTADDFDHRNANLKPGTPTTADTADTASLSFTMTVAGTAPAPAINLLQIVSIPSHDADGDGTPDTYINDDKILIDVTFTEPVEIVGNNAGVRLRLDLGTDDTTPGNSRKVLHSPEVLFGGRVLRFTYTVQDNNGQACNVDTTTADCDSDGVWVQTAGTEKNVIFLVTGSSVVSALSGAGINRTIGSLPTDGSAWRTHYKRGNKVDGAVTDSAGARPESAAVNGDTLTVTFNRPMGVPISGGTLAERTASKAANKDKLRSDFLVQGAGELTDDNLVVYQSPKSLSLPDNSKIVTMKLNDPALPGQTVTLTFDAKQKVLLSGNPAKQTALFRDLPVTNNTPGAGGPEAKYGVLSGQWLLLEFDGELDPASAPPGNVFRVRVDRHDGLQPEYVLGEGTAMVSGSTVRVKMPKELLANRSAVRLATVNYRYPVPRENALRAKHGGNLVLPFNRVRIETRIDTTAPNCDAMRILGSVNPYSVGIYCNELLDTSSTPPLSAFTLTTTGFSGTVSLSALTVKGYGITFQLTATDSEGNAATLPTTQNVKIAYERPDTNRLQDKTGNPVEDFDLTKSRVPNVPTLRIGAAATVNGSKVSIPTQNLDPSSVEFAGAFSLTYPDPTSPDTTLGTDPYPNRVDEVGIVSNVLIERFARVLPSVVLEE